MSIKHILDGLPEQQRRQLMYAFEHGFEQHVELPGNRFVGVNVATIKNLEILEQAGSWAYGNVKKGSDEQGTT